MWSTNNENAELKAALYIIDLCLGACRMRAGGSWGPAGRLPMVSVCRWPWRRPARVCKLLMAASLGVAILMLLIYNTSPPTAARIFNGRLYKSPGESSLPSVVHEKPRDVKLLMMLSYQRSGSTYISRLFNEAGSTFFLYEPLDPLYTAMYGTRAGWNVPDDIFNFRNGSMRPIPQDEIDAIRWALEQILTCNMSSLPPAILGHIFWGAFAREQPAAGSYVRCLSSNGAKMVSSCQRTLSPTCGVRFGEKTPAQQDQCKKYLWGTELPVDNFVPLAVQYANAIKKPTGVPRSISTYLRCISQWTSVERECAADVLDRACRGATVRAVKTVRATMDVPEALLKKYDNFYLLHSFRDPRGAVLSRSRSKWSRGIYGKGANMANEARIYCANVRRDYLLRKRLELLYPNRTRDVLYDEFVSSPLDSGEEIYNFLHTPMPRDVMASFARNHLNRAASLSKADNWKTELRKESLAEIADECREFFQDVQVREWTHVSSPTGSR